MANGNPRAAAIVRRIKAVCARRRKRVHLLTPVLDLAGNRYLRAGNEPPDLGPAWRFSEGDSVSDGVDIVLVITNGLDSSPLIWSLRDRLPDAVFLIWLWDNHLVHFQNLKTVLAADGFFASHAYAHEYLINPQSAYLGHLPACCAQWSSAELSTGVMESLSRPRSDKFYAAYVDYGFSRRSPFLRQLAALPEGMTLLMHPDDRTRYFGMSKQDQLREWCSYKTSVVAPLDRDLSTRLFDGLACGQIPLVSDAVADLDIVVSPADQASLPIMRYAEGNPDSLRQAHAAALAHFDAETAEGMLRRHRYVLTRHHLSCRLGAMLRALLEVAGGRLKIEFSRSASAAGIIATRHESIGYWLESWLRRKTRIHPRGTK